MKKIFSLDAETNGLWGEAFAIAALVLDEGGKEIARFVGRCPIEGTVEPWVAEHVLPQLDAVRGCPLKQGVYCPAFSSPYMAMGECHPQRERCEAVKTAPILPVSHGSYAELLAAFAGFYLANAGECDVIAHIAVPVEARIFLDLHEAGLIGDWEAPFPLIDVAGSLAAVGADPTTVDEFAADNGIDVGQFVGGTHNPLYDCAVAAAVYRHIRWSTAKCNALYQERCEAN